MPTLVDCLKGSVRLPERYRAFIEESRTLRTLESTQSAVTVIEALCRGHDWRNPTRKDVEEISEVIWTEISIGVIDEMDFYPDVGLFSEKIVGCRYPANGDALCKRLEARFSLVLGVYLLKSRLLKLDP